MNIIYAQKTLFPTHMAHAVHTYVSIAEMLEHGAEPQFFPGGILGKDKETLKTFFYSLGFSPGFAQNAQAIPFKNKGLYSIGFRWRLLMALCGTKNGKPTVVHASSVKEACMALDLKRLTGSKVPISFEIHHLVSINKTGESAKKWEALERKAFSGVDMIVFISEDLRRIAKDCMPEPKRAITLPSGFNEKTIFPIPYISAITSDNSVNLAYLGSLQAGKGLEHLIAAMPLLPENYRLKILGGKGKSLVELTQQARELGLEKRVQFTGQLEQREIRQELLNCNIFVIPLSTDKNFFSPMKLFEGLGFALPIVCSPMPTLHEHLKEQENAVFANQNTPEGLAKAILELGENKDMQQKMRVANADKSKNHTNARRMEKLLAEYAALFKTVHS